MSKKRKSAPMGNMSWMNELSGLAKKAKTKKGNRDLNKITSYPDRLIRDGLLIKWKPFIFKIHKVHDKKDKTMDIIEVDRKTKRKRKGALPVQVRIGTQPTRFIESKNLNKKTLYCESYSITKVEGDHNMFIWEIEDQGLREKQRNDRLKKISKRCKLYKERMKLPPQSVRKVLDISKAKIYRKKKRKYLK
jgi:hypothetical protein